MPGLFVDRADPIVAISRGAEFSNLEMSVILTTKIYLLT